MWNLGRIFSQGEVIWNYPACSDLMSVTACGAMSSLSLCSSLPTLCLQATLRGRLSFWINGPTCTPTCPQARHTEEDEMKNSSQVADDLLLDKRRLWMAWITAMRLKLTNLGEALCEGTLQVKWLLLPFIGLCTAVTNTDLILICGLNPNVIIAVRKGAVAFSSATRWVLINCSQ